MTAGQMPGLPTARIPASLLPALPRYPLAAAAASLALGIALCRCACFEASVAAAFALALASPFAPGHFRTLSSSAAFMALGAFLLVAGEARLGACGFDFSEGRFRGLVRVIAVLEESPSVFDETGIDGRIRGRIPVRLVSAACGAGWLRIDGRAILHHRGIQQCIGAGDEVEITGIPWKPGPSGVPGVQGYGEYLAAKGFCMGLTADEPFAVRLRGSAGFSPLAAVERLRTSLLRAIAEEFEPRTAGLLASLVLGDRKGLDVEVQDSFVRSGTVHMLSVSGLHIMVVLAVAYRILVIAGLGLKPRAVALSAAAFFFACLTGLNEPVLRAAIMCAAYLSADLFRRKRSGPAAIAAAALVILAVKPQALFGAGFQLSFVAVIFIGLLAPRVSGYFLKDVRLAIRLSGSPLVGERAKIFFWESASVSVAAWIGTAPIVLWHFCLVTPVVVPANLIIAPPVFFLLSAGFAGLPFIAAGSPLSIPFSAVLEPVAAGLFFLVDALAAAPLSHFYVPKPPWFPVAMHFSGLVLALSAKRAVRVAGMAALIASWAVFLWPLAARRDDGLWKVAVVDVGHGLCAVCTSPGGKVLLYDAGSKGYDDVGARVIAPYLWSRGIGRIDVLVLSHADTDHVNGALAIAERFPVGRAVVGRDFDRFPEGAAVISGMESLGVRVERAAAGDVIGEFLPAHAEFLHPGGDAAARRKVNDGSLVLRVSFPGGGTALFCGDLEETGIAELKAMNPGLDTDMVLVPHHGASAPFGNAWLASVSSIAAISADPGEKQKETLMLYERKGCRAYWTSSSGTVTATFGRDGSIRCDAHASRGFPMR